MSVHQKEKQKFYHKCNICEKDFTEAGSLRKHILVVHEGKRNFKCDICGKAYGEARHLKNHKLNVHDGAKFKCDQCDKSFFQG